MIGKSYIGKEQGMQSVKLLRDPLLSELQACAARFLSFVENARLADKSKDYLRNGWRLLAATSIGGMRMDRISTEDVNALSFPGNAYNINCALKTLRRVLNLAREWELITKVPKIKLAKESWTQSAAQ